MPEMMLGMVIETLPSMLDHLDSILPRDSLLNERNMSLWFLPLILLHATTVSCTASTISQSTFNFLKPSSISKSRPSALLTIISSHWSI
uniref:Uncharacterized protein n=1 Tax=Nelumbo nucifera TaxID=4432 RepID=A0A822YUX1_NELNU|nr:TPA_asm: hypothetical protein HUJ06_005535 [Nelumbo nucifera]